MATEKRSVAFILEQGAAAGTLTARAMFGEYGLYLDGKIVALICDDTLFVKVTEPGRDYLGEPVMGASYPGAKPAFKVTLDDCEDADWLAQLLKITAKALPEPKPKKPKHGT